MEINNTQKFLPYTRKALRNFLEFSGIPKIIWSLLGILLVAFFTIIEPFFLAKTVSFIEEYYQTENFFIENFLSFLGLWAIFIFLHLGFSYIHRYYIADVPSLEFHNYIASKYVNNLLFMNMKAYLSKKTGGIYKDFDRGSGSHFELTFFLLTNALKTIFTLVSILVVIFFVNWKMALAALIMLPFMAITGWLVNKKTI